MRWWFLLECNHQECMTTHNCSAFPACYFSPKIAFNDHLFRKKIKIYTIRVITAMQDSSSKYLSDLSHGILQYFKVRKKNWRRKGTSVMFRGYKMFAAEFFVFCWGHISAVCAVLGCIWWAGPVRQSRTLRSGRTTSSWWAWWCLCCWKHQTTHATFPISARFHFTHHGAKVL